MKYKKLILSLSAAVIASVGILCQNQGYEISSELLWTPDPKQAETLATLTDSPASKAFQSARISETRLQKSESEFTRTLSLRNKILGAKGE